MAWSELDGDLWTIPPARRGKTDTAHSVPITPKARAILEELRERDTDHTHIFATRTDTVPETAALARALTRAYNSGGLAPPREEERWRPHDLRRTMRTGLAAAGISDTVAEAAVGHTRKGIAAVYDRHTYDAEKRAALEAWEKRLDAIMSRKTEASNEAAQTLPS